MAYGDPKKPEMAAYRDPEKLITSGLNQEQLMIFASMKEFLQDYKTKVTDKEKFEFGGANRTREKIRTLEDKIVLEKQIKPKDYIVWQLLLNTLIDGHPFPQKSDLDLDTDSGDIQRYITESFAVKENGLL